MANASRMPCKKISVILRVWYETMYDEPDAGKKNPLMRDRDITGTTNEQLAAHDADLGTIPVEPDETQSTINPPAPDRDRDFQG